MVTYKLDSCIWYHFLRIGVFHITSYLKFGMLDFSWIKNVKSSWKKSGMAITLAKYRLGSFSWCHFVRIGFLHMTSYSIFEIFEISWIKNVESSWKKSGMTITLAKYKLGSSSWCHFVRIGVYQMISYTLRKFVLWQHKPCVWKRSQGFCIVRTQICVG
jgi:hypothetical protein